MKSTHYSLLGHFSIPELGSNSTKKSEFDSSSGYSLDPGFDQPDCFYTDRAATGVDNSSFGQAVGDPLFKELLWPISHLRQCRIQSNFCWDE